MLELVFLEDLGGGTSNYDFRHAGEVEIGWTLVWSPYRMPSEDMKADD